MSTHNNACMARNLTSHLHGRKNRKKNENCLEVVSKPRSEAFWQFCQKVLGEAKRSSASGR